MSNLSTLVTIVPAAAKAYDLSCNNKRFILRAS